MYVLLFSSRFEDFEDALESVPKDSPMTERRPQPIANPDAFQFLFPVLGRDGILYIYCTCTAHVHNTWQSMNDVLIIHVSHDFL